MTEKFKAGAKAEKIPVLFRNCVPEIPATTYGTFAVYKYPAKFIPQVIAFVIKKYGDSNVKVFDPFAGYGTVGLVARVYGCDYELWDLNPLIEIIHRTALLNKSTVKFKDLVSLLEEVKNSQKEFVPKWTNLNYWFPEEFLLVLSRSWGFVHSLSEEVKYFFLAPLLKITRYFSWSDEKTHKLYKSSYSKEKVESLLKGNWKGKFYEMLKNEVLKLFNKLCEYEKLGPKPVNFKVKGGVDVLETQLEDFVDVLITSPPYLQAQEYIRSTKMELFWLGYDEEYVKNLQRKEIPYRKVSEIEIFSKRYHEFWEKIKENRLRDLYENYFRGILYAFQNLGEKVKKYMCIFVGLAKIRGIPVPIDDIIVEHLEKFGWKHEVTYVDKILSRVMFETKVNPATGMEDGRIKTEHLVVLKRV